MADKNQKCKHALCNCAVPEGRNYCSGFCEDSAKQGKTEIACGCGHPECSNAA